MRALRGRGVDSASFAVAGGELAAAALSVLGAALAAANAADAATAAPPPRLAEDSRGGGLAGVRPPAAVGLGAQLRGVRRLPAAGVASALPAVTGIAADAALLAVDAAEDDAPLFVDALLFILAWRAARGVTAGVSWVTAALPACFSGDFFSCCCVPSEWFWTRSAVGPSLQPFVAGSILSWLQLPLTAPTHFRCADSKRCGVQRPTRDSAALRIAAWLSVMSAMLGERRRRLCLREKPVLLIQCAGSRVRHARR